MRVSTSVAHEPCVGFRWQGRTTRALGVGRQVPCRHAQGPTPPNDGVAHGTQIIYQYENRLVVVVVVVGGLLSYFLGDICGR